RRLAGAGRAGQRDEIAATDLQRHAAQRRHLYFTHDIRLGEVTNRDECWLLVHDRPPPPVRRPPVGSSGERWAGAAGALLALRPVAPCVPSFKEPVTAVCVPSLRPISTGTRVSRSFSKTHTARRVLPLPPFRPRVADAPACGVAPADA